MYRIYGMMVYFFIMIIKLTLRIEIVGKDKIDNSKSYVLGLWHAKLVTVALALKFIKKRAGLISPSKDGELISVPLEKLGFKTVRASSGKDSVKGLIQLIKILKEGYTIGTPLDGPKGPALEAKHGFIYIAQKSGKPMMFMGAAYSKKWIFNGTWDKLQIPKPFSKVVCLIEGPLYIPKDGNMEEYQKIVEEKLNEVNEKAEKILQEKK